MFQELSSPNCSATAAVSSCSAIGDRQWLAVHTTSTLNVDTNDFLSTVRMRAGER